MPTPEDIRELFAVHTGPVATSERLERAYAFDDTATWRDERGYTLSDRVWGSRASTRSQIDAILRQAIATGEDALETAKKLEQFLDPSLAPYRDVAGRLVRGQRPMIVTRWPGRGGMGSFPARRLARTEVTRAHSQATAWAAQRNPFVLGIQWLLSGRHPKSDPCDQHARQDVGLGAGVYPPENAPTMPEHPMCLCVYAPVAREDTDAVINELREMFGLGSVNA